VALFIFRCKEWKGPGPGADRGPRTVEQLRPSISVSVSTRIIGCAQSCIPYLHTNSVVIFYQIYGGPGLGGEQGRDKPVHQPTSGGEEEKSDPPVEKAMVIGKSWSRLSTGLGFDRRA
jgi:hypothetical protein